MRSLFLACVLATATALPVLAEAESAATAANETSPVGMPARLEQVVLPGPELVAKPIDSEGPMVLRIVNTFPHGSDFRYDIEYYGLEAGKWNLADFLERKDGSEATGLPEIGVEITTTLPPGQVEPGALEGDTVRGLGGYQIAMILGGVAWVIGLLVILLSGRKKTNESNSGESEPASLADRLRPVVEQAIAGDLPDERLAELEMMLVAFWRKQLGIEHADADEVIPRLRAHSAAGPLLKQLESWLHRPKSDETVIDVGDLLAPYRELPPDAFDDVLAEIADSSTS
ncbi:MAG: hypothetical protein O2820_17215 [Planctomycetota bacterium]|nr:hypothetical protein [Planctomycetota bacterium]MDA1250960.1 hypothetical protein [Planctomycetota bacterium]